jgi:hypothetical protein
MIAPWAPESPPPPVGPPEVHARRCGGEEVRGLLADNAPPGRLDQLLQLGDFLDHRPPPLVEAFELQHGLTQTTSGRLPGGSRTLFSRPPALLEVLIELSA